MEKSTKTKKKNTSTKTKSETKKAETSVTKKKKTTSSKTKSESKKNEVIETKKKSTSTKVKKESKKAEIVATKKKETTTKKTTVSKSYYMFKMNTYYLNGFSILLLIFCTLIFYLLYGNDSFNVVADNINIVIVLYIPYLILHEQLHSLGYVIYGADFKNITFGAHLEKGILCCLCKQNIDKRNILHSLLYPFYIIGVLTLIIGILVNYPVLIILSLANIAGCSGDLLMFYHLRKLDDFSFSEYNDPIGFGLYTKNDFSKLKMFGLDYVGKKSRLVRDDLRKVVISKASILILVVFYALMIFALSV